MAIQFSPRRPNFLQPEALRRRLVRPKSCASSVIKTDGRKHAALGRRRYNASAYPHELWGDVYARQRTHRVVRCLILPLSSVESALALRRKRVLPASASTTISGVASRNLEHKYSVGARRGVRKKWGRARRQKTRDEASLKGYAIKRPRYFFWARPFDSFLLSFLPKIFTKERPFVRVLLWEEY